MACDKQILNPEGDLICNLTIRKKKLFSVPTNLRFTDWGIYDGLNSNLDKARCQTI